jgi:hypothetical protein
MKGWRHCISHLCATAYIPGGTPNVGMKKGWLGGEENTVKAKTKQPKGLEQSKMEILVRSL